MSQFLFVTDLDNTFVGDDKALEILSNKLSEHRQEYGTKIVYATGRSRTSYQELQAEKNLLEPDALVVAVGTEIYLEANQMPDADWVEKLSPMWNRELVVEITSQFPELVPQQDSEQRPFKVSFLVPESDAAVLSEVESILKQQDLDIKLIYSSGIDLDIVPSRSDKGQAMQFLRQKWSIAAERTVTCGDSGNDIALFAVGDERGIIVGNAQPELLDWYNENQADYHYLAKDICAGGILEGLQYFGFMA